MLMRRVIRGLVFAVLVTLTVIASPAPVQATGENDRQGGATTASLNEGNDGHVSYPDDEVDWWVVWVPEPGVLRVILEVHSLSDDLDLAVFPSGDACPDVSVSDNPPGFDEEAEVVLTEPGSVFIKVYAYGRGDSADYTLTPEFGRSLDPGIPVIDSVDYRTDRVDYREFEPPTGSSVVYVVLMGETDLDLKLLSPSCRVIASSTDPGAEEFVVVPNIFDTYFVKVYAYGENDGSDYVLMADAE